MAKAKKPTMMEMKNVVTNLIMQIEKITFEVNQINAAFASYIHYNKDVEGFGKFLEKETEELKENEEPKDKKYD